MQMDFASAFLSARADVGWFVCCFLFLPVLLLLWLLFSFLLHSLRAFQFHNFCVSFSSYALVVVAYIHGFTHQSTNRMVVPRLLLKPVQIWKNASKNINLILLLLCRPEIFFFFFPAIVLFSLFKTLPQPSAWWRFQGEVHFTLPSCRAHAFVFVCACVLLFKRFVVGPAFFYFF